MELLYDPTTPPLGIHPREMKIGPHKHFYLNVYSEVKLLIHVQLCDPVDSSLRGSSIHGVFQARVLEWVAISFSRASSQPRILEWVAIPFSRESSQPRDQTQVSHSAGGFFISWATREAHVYSFSIHNSQKGEITQMPINGWMNKQQ